VAKAKEKVVAMANSLEKNKKNLPTKLCLSDIFKAKPLKKLKKGYREMASVNIEWAENCLVADNDCQQQYEENLSECE